MPESCIDLTTSPLKKRSQKSQLEYEEFVDLTESPVKFPVYSDTELFTQSQSEDETGSFVSEFVIDRSLLLLLSTRFLGGGRISSCGCLGLCTGQPQIPCCVRSTDATAKNGGIPGVILRCVWRRWTRSGYPIVRVLLVV